MASAVRFASAYAAPSDAAIPWNSERREPERVADLQALLQRRHGGGGVPLPEVDHPHPHARHDQSERVLQSLGEAQRLLRPARGLPELAELGERPRQIGRVDRHQRRQATGTEGVPGGLEGAQDLAERGGGLPIVTTVVVDSTQLASRLAPQQAVTGRLGDGEGAVD